MYVEKHQTPAYVDYQGIKSALHIVILQKTSHIYIIMNDSCVGNPKEGLAFKFSMKRPFNLFFFFKEKRDLSVKTTKTYRVGELYSDT